MKKKQTLGTWSTVMLFFPYRSRSMLVWSIFTTQPVRQPTKNVSVLSHSTMNFLTSCANSKSSTPCKVSWSWSWSHRQPGATFTMTSGGGFVTKLICQYRINLPCLVVDGCATASQKIASHWGPFKKNCGFCHWKQFRDLHVESLESSKACHSLVPESIWIPALSCIQVDDNRTYQCIIYI